MRIENAITVRTERDLLAALAPASAPVDSPASLTRPRGGGPTVIVAKVAESAPTAKPVRDYVFIKRRFMAALGVPEC